MKKVAAWLLLVFPLLAVASAHEPKPEAQPHVVGEACDDPTDLVTSRSGVVLSCKGGKLVADGAIWGSQWSHDPMFLLKQAVGDATRAGRQCESTALVIRQGTTFLALSTASMDTHNEVDVRKVFGASALTVFRAAETAVTEANARGLLVDRSALRTMAAGTGYVVETEGLCAERAKVSSR